MYLWWPSHDMYTIHSPIFYEHYIIMCSSENFTSLTSQTQPTPAQITFSITLHAWYWKWFGLRLMGSGLQDYVALYSISWNFDDKGWSCHWESKPGTLTCRTSMFSTLCCLRHFLIIIYSQHAPSIPVIHCEVNTLVSNMPAHSLVRKTRVKHFCWHLWSKLMCSIQIRHV